MTPDSITPAQGDPVAVILARMEVKLDNALTEQARHVTRLDAHDTQIGSLRDRVTAIESSRPKNIPAWAAVAVAGLALIASFITPLIRA